MMPVNTISTGVNKRMVEIMQIRRHPRRKFARGMTRHNHTICETRLLYISNRVVKPNALLCTPCRCLRSHSKLTLTATKDGNSLPPLFKDHWGTSICLILSRTCTRNTILSKHLFRLTQTLLAKVHKMVIRQRECKRLY